MLRKVSMDLAFSPILIHMFSASMRRRVRYFVSWHLHCLMDLKIDPEMIKILLHLLPIECEDVEVHNG